MPAPPAPSMVRAANTWAANSTGRDVSCNNNRKHQLQPTEIRHEPKRLHTDCPDEPSKDRLDARRTKIKALIKSPNSDDQSSPKEDLFISKCNAYINEMCRKLGMIALQLLEPIAEYLDTIASHSCQDAEVDAWIAKIEEACHVTLPFLKVAMEGATGTGKSSTINSLINANVAGTACAGESVTQVPFEFHHGRSEDELRVEVHLRNRDESRRLFRDTLEDIITYLRWVTVTDDDPEFANRPDGSLLKDLEPRYLSGRQTFFDVFQRAYEKNTLDQRFKSCIDNPERKQEFLASVDRMVSNVLSLDENNYGGTHVATKVARSEKELKSRDFKEFLVRYTKDVKRPSGPSKKYPILWPFVEVVRWYIGGNHQSSILESGVILLDLPGVTDSNLFRQDVSIAAQRGCDATVIVVNIDRVVNELHTQNLAIKAIEQCQSNTRQELFVVCTRSEITDAIGNVDYDEDTLGHDHTNATEIKDLYDELENELESASPDELKSLQSDRRCLQRKLQELQAIHRNDSVVKKIREKFSEWTAASKYAHLDITPSPKILCVSNTEYNARRTHEDLSSTIFPSISDTGIPRVREELIRSALKARISTLEEHISDKLQIMLYDLGRDCRPTTTKQPMLNHLHKAISTAEEEHLRIIEQKLDDIQRLMDEFVAGLYTRESAWSETAKQHWTQWPNCHGKQFLTHCAAKGLYVPRGASPFATAKQCWLEQLVDSPRNHFVVAKAFSKLLDQSEKSFYGIIKWVMQDLEKLLNKHESQIPPDYRAGEDYIPGMKRRIAQFIRSVTTVVARETIPSLRTTGEKAYDYKKTDAFLFVDLKNELADVATHIKGAGAPAKRKERVMSYMGSDSFSFANISTGIEDEFNQCISALRQKVLNEARDYFAQMRKGLNKITRNIDAGSNPDMNQMAEHKLRLQAEFRKKVPEYLNVVNEELEPLLKALKSLQEEGTT